LKIQKVKVFRYI